MPHQKKATTEQLVAAYRKTKSVHKTAKMFDMCGQSVHERLAGLGVIDSRAYSESEQKVILDFYRDGFGKVLLKDFCRENGFHPANVCRWARQRGLTSRTWTRNEIIKQAMSARSKIWHQSHPHPKGFLGRTHAPETKRIIGVKSVAAWKGMLSSDKASRAAKIIATRVRKFGSAAPKRDKTTWKSGWRTIGGRGAFFRSSWEANYARYLDYRKRCGLISRWEHEPLTFFFPGVISGPVSYLPDFRVTNKDASTEYHEVKGWMDAKSKLKLRRMKKHHPSIRIFVRSSKWFKQWNSKLKAIIHEWE